MSNRIKIILIIMILLAIVLLTVTVLMPNLFGGINKNTSIEQEKINNQSLNEQLNKLLIVKDEYNMQNAEYQKFSLQLPLDSDISVFTNEIDDIAEYSNVDIYSIDYTEKAISEEEKKMGLVIIEVDLAINGSYYDILNFINTLEKIPRIVKIQSFIIQSTEDDYEYLNSYIKAYLYYKK